MVARCVYFVCSLPFHRRPHSAPSPVGFFFFFSSLLLPPCPRRAHCVARVPREPCRLAGGAGGPLPPRQVGPLPPPAACHRPPHQHKPGCPPVASRAWLPAEGPPTSHGWRSRGGDGGTRDPRSRASAARGGSGHAAAASAARGWCGRRPCARRSLPLCPAPPLDGATQRAAPRRGRGGSAAPRAATAGGAPSGRASNGPARLRAPSLALLLSLAAAAALGCAVTGSRG